MLGFLLGLVVGGAIVYVFKAYIQKKVEDTLPGDPPVV